MFSTTFLEFSAVLGVAYGLSRQPRLCITFSICVTNPRNRFFHLNIWNRNFFNKRNIFRARLSSVIKSHEIISESRHRTNLLCTVHLAHWMEIMNTKTRQKMNQSHMNALMEASLIKFRRPQVLLFPSLFTIDRLLLILSPNPISLATSLSREISCPILPERRVKDLYYTRPALYHQPRWASAQVLFDRLFPMDEYPLGDFIPC